jgi:hypothetical protein
MHQGKLPQRRGPLAHLRPQRRSVRRECSLPGGESAVLINKSTDGGLTWSDAIQINPNGDAKPDRGADKPSITADPTHPGYVYAVWNQDGHGQTIFTRTVDGGQTWEPSRIIHQAPGTDFNERHQIVVLPDGTLVCAFTEGEYTNNGQVALTLLRSSDQGQTWSAPISAVVQQPLIDPNLQPPNNLLTDPDTGQLVESHPNASVAVDPHSGNLYAVWLDGRFSNFQYNSIALSMSSDGGFTWSAPVQVNQTPNTVPPIDRQAWNPTVAVAADGMVAVTYYDFRNNTPAPGALTDSWLASCQPSASAQGSNLANWNEVRLTDTSFNLEQAATRFYAAFFLGDYDGLAAVGNDFVAVWGMPDGSGSNQESIYLRRAISSDGDVRAAAAAVAGGPATTNGMWAAAVATPLVTVPGHEPVHSAVATLEGSLATGRPNRGPRFLANLDATLLDEALPDARPPGPIG